MFIFRRFFVFRFKPVFDVFPFTLFSIVLATAARPPKTLGSRRNRIRRIITTLDANTANDTAAIIATIVMNNKRLGELFNLFLQVSDPLNLVAFVLSAKSDSLARFLPARFHDSEDVVHLLGVVGDIFHQHVAEGNQFSLNDVSDAVFFFFLACDEQHIIEQKEPFFVPFDALDGMTFHRDEPIEHMSPVWRNQIHIFLAFDGRINHRVIRLSIFDDQAVVDLQHFVLVLRFPFFLVYPQCQL